MTRAQPAPSAVPDAASAAVSERAAFSPGARVRVLDAWPPGHVRTPAYIRGHIGTVVDVLGRYPNPEEIAFRRSGLPGSVLYRVRFRQRSVWSTYRGPDIDTLDIEIYDQWLEPA